MAFVSLLRPALVAAAALVLLVTAVRTAGVLAFAERRPDLAAALWPAHPVAIIQTGFAEIGQATAAGREPSIETVAAMRQVVQRDPLAVEPLLVEGASLLSAGQTSQAERLLSEAAERDPRNPAARFLLAQLYLEEGRIAQGLEQVAALVRRVPGAARSLTPALAEFARQPGAAPQVRALLEENPNLRRGVLETLAANAANTDLILMLAGPQSEADGIPDWQTRLLNTLVDNADYVRAHRLWQRFAEVPPAAQPGLFNPGFKPLTAPPPFNWSFSQSSAGIAEPTAAGLHVLYYGREDAQLAAQTLLLRPGHYRLSFSVRGSPEATAAIVWVVTCLPGKNIAVRQPSQTGEVRFNIPAAQCPAQTLELRGAPADLSGTADLYVTDLRLTKVPA